jgi:predicted nucleic acid-binding protein
MAYLIDTDWIIQALAGREQVVTTIDRLAAQRISVSILSLGEVYEAAFHSTNSQAYLTIYREFIAPLAIVPLSEPIMERFAEIRAHLRRRGQLISDFDILIAASALQHDLTLLTYNLRHFERIPELRTYKPS